jgi:serine O-acetyltransferase
MHGSAGQNGTVASPSRPVFSAPPAQAPVAAPGLLSQLAEDFRTHDRNPLEPGFWAVSVHRFGRWREKVRSPLLRRPLGAAYRALSTTTDWLWGISIHPSVELGRRVRIWHHGCISLAARSIGDDVHIRQNTTLGPVLGRREDPAEWPVIGDRVQLGSGACVLGGVTVGSDSFVGANTVVLRSFPSHSRVMGVPGRLIPSG